MVKGIINSIFYKRKNSVLFLLGYAGLIWIGIHLVISSICIVLDWIELYYNLLNG